MNSKGPESNSILEQMSQDKIDITIGGVKNSLSDILGSVKGISDKLTSLTKGIELVLSGALKKFKASDKQDTKALSGALMGLVTTIIELKKILETKQSQIDTLCEELEQKKEFINSLSGENYKDEVTGLGNVLAFYETLCALDIDQKKYKVVKIQIDNFEKYGAISSKVLQYFVGKFGKYIKEGSIDLIKVGEDLYSLNTNDFVLVIDKNVEEKSIRFLLDKFQLFLENDKNRLPIKSTKSSQQIGKEKIIFSYGISDSLQSKKDMIAYMNMLITNLDRILKYERYISGKSRNTETESEPKVANG